MVQLVETETSTALQVAAVTGALQITDGLGSVSRHTRAELVRDSQANASVEHPARAGAFEQLQRARQISRTDLASRHHGALVEAAQSIALFARLPVQRQSARQVLRHAVAVLVHDAEIVATRGVAASARFLEQVFGRTGVPVEAPPG